MRIFLIGLLILASVEVHALSVSDVRQECHGARKRVVTKVSFNLQVGGDAGVPGLLYIAVHNPTSEQATLFSPDGGWQEWEGGMLPIFQVMRDGLQDMNIEIPLGANFSKFRGHPLYVGYGLYLPGMEEHVRKWRLGLEKAREKFPDRQLYDPGDDYVRRAFVEKEMKDSERYLKVVDIAVTGCALSD
ncbi:MAG: hypothetical protein A3J24_11295 [Deltaproteobacteria bacterium RIFCSPLOWO2_02_FULL_53_8]|nr:MAG: hypothetical protein A3J24_11295 [Deltaproteobacteria bacterium RIFCSPLOWO2_02_FULL_53_8]